VEHPKDFTGTNTLAFYEESQFTTVKSFVTSVTVVVHLQRQHQESSAFRPVSVGRFFAADASLAYIRRNQLRDREPVRQRQLRRLPHRLRLQELEDHQPAGDNVIKLFLFVI
jgi:hypothetical protein